MSKSKSYPQILINMHVNLPAEVCKKMGWGRFSKKEDFAIVHKGDGFVLGYDYEEGFRFMVPLDKVREVVAYIRRINATIAKKRDRIPHTAIVASTIPTFPTPSMVRFNQELFAKKAKAAIRAAGFVPAHMKTRLGIFEIEVLDPKVLNRCEYKLCTNTVAGTKSYCTFHAFLQAG